MKIGQNSPESQETGFLPKIPCFCGATVDGSKKSQVEPVDRLVFFYPNDFTGFWADDIFENAPNQTTSVDGCRCPGAQFPNDSSLRGSVCNDSRDSGTSRVKSRSFHYLQKQLALQVHVF